MKKAGIKLRVSVMLGVGGTALSREHARATGELLSKMQPDYVGALTLMLVPGTPMYDAYERGEFELPGVTDMIHELREMIAHTDLDGGTFYSNHASNYLPIEAVLPQERDKTLALIDKALEGRVGLKPEWMRAL